VKKKGLNMFNIVLFEPEIPQNTGNIARTCALTGTKLHLIEPLGFSVSDKAVKRAGLDYWDMADVTTYLDFETFLEANENPEPYLLTTHSHRSYADIAFKDNDYIMFGRETAGLPDAIHARYPDKRFRIPMRNHPRARSLNLANSVNIVLYEALRQNQFFDLI
jgi:tRNA (cytidine/uridine-2'-O-)-methyltransferase